MKLPDLKLKRPQLKRKASGGSKSSVKAPKFATDLYADLRDRRLLPLVAVLLVAIVSVPLLLASKDDDEATTPTVPAAGGATAAAQASFAVVPEAPTLRDYRARLGHRQPRDPFRQPPAPAKPSSGADTESSTGSEGAGGESASAEAETEAPAAPKTTTKVVVQDKVLGYEIDAKAGFVGHVKSRDGIAPSTRLPSAENPVIVFTGFSKDKKGALFLMSSNVTAYYGKAHCAFDKQACQLVELRSGKSATFAYGYGEARYKLTLKKIVPVIDTREAEATVTTGQQGGGNGGLSTTTR
jgi:hypothetical protein